MALATTVLVPLANPASATALMALAGALTTDDGGMVVPVTVVPANASERDREAARDLVIDAERRVEQVGGSAHGLVIGNDSVVEGVLDAAAEAEATMVLMGWRGKSTHRNVFGGLIDSIVGRSRTPMAVVRQGAVPFERILLPVADDHLVSAGQGGLELAIALASRLVGHADRRVRVLRTGERKRELPQALTALSDRVHHDPRRYAVATGAAADARDLVVVPVAPTASGLRTATTHVAWAAPDATLLVAVDVGPQPTDASAATVKAGRPAPSPASEPRVAREHMLVVTARLHSDSEASHEHLTAALSLVGPVEPLAQWADDDGCRCLRTAVRVRAPGSKEALASVMTALNDAAALRGAELRYEFV